MGIRDWFRRKSSTEMLTSDVTDAPSGPVVDVTDLSKAVVVDPVSFAEKFTPNIVFIDSSSATSNANIPVPEGYELVKSEAINGEMSKFELPPMEGASSPPSSLMYDPFSMIEQLGFRERPTTVTYATCDTMVARVPIIQAIIQTRINQVTAFCSPQHHRFEPGFRIKMRDIDDKPTAADKKFMKAAEKMILQCGTDSVDPRLRDNFATFVRKSIRDSMVFDQMNWEIVPARDGRPGAWYAVDAKSIRLANTGKLYPVFDLDSVRCVQIYDNIIINEYTGREMAFEVRNPRTDIRLHGYGTSELEMLVSIITGILWGMQYNQNMFAQGSLQKGLLNLKGAIPERQLRAFRRQWYQMLSGVTNSWRTPITNAEEIEWINMQNSNKDMEFSAWLDFLIKVACSVYAIDPMEVNFKYGQQGGGKSMFEGANKSKIVESKDRGLRPLLKFVASAIDKNILWPINPNFTFEFVGLDSQTPKELADLMTQRVRTIYTIDEVRAEQDLPPLPDKTGQVILDANWMNIRKEVQAKKDQEEAEKKQEAELEAQAAALASAAGAHLSQEEIASVAQALAGQQTAQSGMPVGNSGGPGGGKVAPSPPPMGKSLVKSANSGNLVIDVEI